MSDQGAPQQKGLAMVPGGVAALIMGITGCCLGWVYGIPGLVFSIIGMAMSGRSRNLLAANPTAYKGQKLANAARTWSIVGLVESIIMTVVFSIVIIAGIFAATTSPNMFR
jgi:hypothetical protein